jgi:hypothetical protein
MVEGDDGETIPTSRLVIIGETDARADDLLVTRSHDERSDLELAGEWLADELADGGWHESRDVKAAAKAAGIAERTLERAREQLGAERDRRGFPSRAVWRLTVPPSPLAGLSRQEVGGTGGTRIPEPKTTSGDPQSRQVSDIGGTGPCDDLRACLTPTYLSAHGNRCERCDRYVPGDRGRARRRQPIDTDPTTGRPA